MKKNGKILRQNILLLAAVLMCIPDVCAQKIDVTETEDYSPYIYGHNLEHTRAAVNGGLSAQMLRNRKFAGKPSRNRGVASKWFGIGEKVLFSLESKNAYTRHICHFNMHRGNEILSQVIQNLVEEQTAGLGQYGISLVAGKEYEMRAVTRVSTPVELKVELTNRKGDKVYATHTMNLMPTKEWVVNSFEITSLADDNDGCVRYSFNEKGIVAFGALSMMPADNFHGMRTDVVANLKAIGPKLLRWPGGNFAGEYRWKDGLLPVDERGPLGAWMEMETQPYGDGYDYHEINTDDFIALCREVGAEPLLTINLVWSTPEESAQWVEYCNGSVDTEYGKLRAERGHAEPYNVRIWSLGNEMGYGHMEGPKGPEGYASMATHHADAMLKVSPELEFCSSGPYPNDDWAKKSAAAMSDKVKYISLHHYSPDYSDGHGLRYTTLEEIKATYNWVVESIDGNVDIAKRMRKSLDATGEKLHISFDEWNQWYSWYRPSCVTEGIYAARIMHFLLNKSNELDMPIVCYFQPVGEGAILIEPNNSRLTANGQVFAMMKAHQDGKLCKVVENEDFSTAATLKDGVLTVTLINSSYDAEREFDFALKGKLLDAKLLSSEEVTPYSYFSESALDVKKTKKQLIATLPPHSVAIVRINMK